MVTEYRGTARTKEDLRPRITLLDEKSGEAARYMLSPGAMLSVEDGQTVEAGDVLARVTREAAKTRDITGGLPRVAELFEARKPKENAIIAKVSGRIAFGKDYKAKRKIAIIPEEGGDPVEYLVPKSKVIDVQEGDFVKRGDNLIGGSPDPHDILEVLGVEALAEYLVVGDPGGLSSPGREDQRQAHRGDRSPDAAEGRDHRGGDTTFLVGEQVDRAGDERVQRQAEARARRSRPKASRCCSASPRRACRRAASSRPPRSRRRPACSPRPRCRARSTRSNGLKENVIVGRLIPAGTGAGMKRMRIAASSRDAALRAQHRVIQEALDAPNSAEEEHAAELAQGLEAAINSDPLAEVTSSGHGTDADAGDYLKAEADADRS